jgi:hypothetical protein
MPKAYPCLAKPFIKSYIVRLNLYQSESFSL